MPVAPLGGTLPAPLSSIVIAVCSHPAPNSGAGFTAQPFDTFYDQQQTDITATINAALAAMGLSIDATKTTLTVTESGIYAFSATFASISPGPTAHICQATLYGGAGGGISWAGPTVEIPVGSTGQSFSVSATDALKVGDSIKIGTAGIAEQDIQYADLIVVRVR